MTRVYESDYMHWAKTAQAARFNLANSGLAACPIHALPITLQDVELSGSSFYGWPPLMSALSRFLKVPENCIVHATGTSFANHLAMAAILQPGDEVLIELPTYELLTATAGYFGARIRRFKRPHDRGFALDLEALERQITPATRLIVLTNLHNPSSAYIDPPTLRAAAALASRSGAYLLVDEVYLDATFDPAVATSFTLAENIIVTSSLTKVYGLSGLRCGWILAQPKLAERLWRLNDLFGVIPAHSAERLSVSIFEHFDIVRERAHSVLDPNRAALNRFFSQRSDLEVPPLTGGTVAFPRLLHHSVEALCEILRKKYETTVVPGQFFEMPEHFRVGIGRDVAEFSEGIRRLGLALDELK